MGTRADFYVGVGKNAEWIGSIAWDGYPDGIDDQIKNATTENDYRDAVTKFFADRDDVTLPDQGWPWPWDDSKTTDYAYAFTDGSVMASSFGHAWFKASEDEPDSGDDEPTEFPDMTDRKNTTYGARSGVIIITS